jgi:hypothetical protein
MPLSHQAVQELKDIHRKNFGEHLTDEEAVAMGNRLLRLFAVILRVPAPPREDSEGSNPVPPAS